MAAGRTMWSEPLEDVIALPAAPDNLGANEAMIP